MAAGICGGAGIAIVVVSALAIATFLHLLRLGLSTSLNSFWAEDGSVFFTGALAGESVLAPYTNYLGHAAAADRRGVDLGPPRSRPRRDLHPRGAGRRHQRPRRLGRERRPHPQPVPAAGAGRGNGPRPRLRPREHRLRLLRLLVPALRQLLAPAWRPRSDWGAALASALILLTALSNATVWFLIPIAVLRAIAIRNRRDAMIVASFALGSVIQVPVALTHGQMADPTWSPDVWSAYAQRVIDGAALGLRLGEIAWRDLGWPFLAPFLGLVAAGFAVGIGGRLPPARAPAVAAVATSVVMFFAIAYQRDVGTTIAWQSGEYSGAVSRCVIVPALLLLSAALALIDSGSRPRGPHTPAVAGRGRRRRGHSGDRGVFSSGANSGSAGDSRLGRRRRRSRRRMPARRRRRSGGCGADLAPGIRRLHAMRQDS